jgi:hypothetical protein
MTRGLWLLLVGALAGALVVAGCGPTTGGGGSGSGTPQTGEQAVAQCEQSIQSAPQLSGKVKKELEDVCQDAAKGDEQAVRRATKQVCETIIEETVPAGPAREQALTSCEQGP